MTRPSLTLDLVEPLRQALAEPLGGDGAHRLMLVTPPPMRNLLHELAEPRQGAVLALLYEGDGELLLAMTRRSPHLRYHGGQVSLPGGTRDPGDASLWETAVREAHEEIGIDPDAVIRLGRLTPIEVPASGYVVQPYVSYTARRPLFVLQADEVAELVELPLGVLLDPSAKGVEQRQLADRVARVPFYRYGDVVIWGATAMILSELEHVLRRICPE